MFLSARAFFRDNSANYKVLVKQAETEIPAEFVKLYRRNALAVTPIGETGYLRRSIITQAIGNRAQIGWRAPYAAAQNVGRHTVKKPIKGPNKRDGGYGTIKPGVYTYPKNAGFAQKAFYATRRQMPAVLRKYRANS
jgi:phage gpG-like protein